MIPIKDNIPTHSFPYLTVLLIGINVGVFFYELSLSPEELEIFVHKYGLLPLDIVQLNFLNLFTHMFIHGGIAHLVGNMLFLWIFGNNVEDALGRVKFLVLYFFSGFFAAFLQSFVAILEGSLNVPMVGASGAISGILAAYVKLYPYAKVLTVIPPFIFFFFVLPAWFFIGYWFILQLLYAMFIPTDLGGVAWYAHIGGFLAGWFLVDKLYKKSLKLVHYSAIRY
ncbi:rhomboid family intramembrane serine protease [Sulfurihydrogenibium subterraneum]|uniref:rhomboid family intramembrane serine protease n=1 Tax=Sulfurihydrogenibium subterraneum TaxID=171121 RepID=UPI00048CD261|nr:rhomboid family intramembrane serine protease [Sulfurihydrogenibium subterraneum]